MCINGMCRETFVFLVSKINSNVKYYFLNFNTMKKHLNKVVKKKNCKSLDRAST